MLDLNANRSLAVRQVKVSMDVLPTTLLYASDLHLAFWNKHIIQQLIRTAENIRPTAILLGGDLVDWPSALPLLHDCIIQLARIAPVLAVPGNHDVQVGVTKVSEVVRLAGGHWLLDTPYIFDDIGLQIDGISQPYQHHKRVLCTHDPSDFPKAVQHGYTLVLAGHLHGGQMVWWTHKNRLYPAAWFFRWNGLCFQHANSTMLVSRGMNDTLPIRWRCPREVIVCHLR